MIKNINQFSVINNVSIQQPNEQNKIQTIIIIIMIFDNEMPEATDVNASFKSLTSLPLSGLKCVVKSTLLTARSRYKF